MVAAADLGGRKESARNLAPKSIPVLAEEGAKREPDRAKPQEKLREPDRAKAQEKLRRSEAKAQTGWHEARAR